MKKKLISLMLVLVLMVCIATVPSMADTSENSTFAYLMYADARTNTSISEISFVFIILLLSLNIWW